MSSQMFCERATLNAAKLSECGGDNAKVHQVTSGGHRRRTVIHFHRSVDAQHVLGVYTELSVDAQL